MSFCDKNSTFQPVPITTSNDISNRIFPNNSTVDLNLCVPHIETLAHLLNVAKEIQLGYFKYSLLCANLLLYTGCKKIIIK